VKSTWPGVSIRWISCFFPLERGAAAVIVVPHVGLAVVDLADLVDLARVERESR
jgi:hypothetical protein